MLCFRTILERFFGHTTSPFTSWVFNFKFNCSDFPDFGRCENVSFKGPPRKLRTFTIRKALDRFASVTFALKTRVLNRVMNKVGEFQILFGEVRQ